MKASIKQGLFWGQTPANLHLPHSTNFQWHEESYGTRHLCLMETMRQSSARSALSHSNLFPRISTWAQQEIKFEGPNLFVLSDSCKPLSVSFNPAEELLAANQHLSHSIPFLLEYCTYLSIDTPNKSAIIAIESLWPPLFWIVISVKNSKIFSTHYLGWGLP